MKSPIKDLRKFIIYWNNRFKYDRLYRKKYNIPFNSKEHRETSQIDIFLEFLEEELVKVHTERYNKKQEALELYEKEGKWYDDSYDEEKEEELLKNFMKGISESE